jgi:sugar lactone lactonase YvrE
MEDELFIPSEDLLGEGPVWDDHRQELLWVDIERKQLHIYHIPSATQSYFQFDSLLSAVVSVENSNLYLLALQNGLAFFDRRTVELTYFDNPEGDISENRFNDGKCDPQGRFWVGSMDCNARSEKGALYRVDQNLEIKKMLDGVTISNGLAWDENKNKMYYIDTPTLRILSFEYRNGEINNPVEIVKVTKKHGFPDGMCIDEEGMIWVAHWGGANVSRWNPENGKLIQIVDVPALHVTSCCFGNNELDVLYITSARQGISEDELKRHPQSGAVFSFHPAVKGAQANKFIYNQH